MSAYDDLNRRVRRAIAEKDHPDVRRGTLADLADLHSRGWAGADMDAAVFLGQAARSKQVRQLCERARARVAAETDRRPQSTAEWLMDVKGCPG